MSGGLLSNPLSAFERSIPLRVVSLVPSWTSSLIDLGLGDKLIGITDYCQVSGSKLEQLVRVGGPKTPLVEKIVSLKPDLIIANQEENGREEVEELAASDLPVWLTFPQTVRAMLDDLRTAASLFRSDAALAKIQTLEQSMEWVEYAAQNQRPVRTFSPIWQDRLDSGEYWWMTFNASTYSHDIIRICGGHNVFEDRKRRYPLLAEFGRAMEESPEGRDTRYPRVSYEEIIETQPEVILLPDEPFNFTGQAFQEFTSLFEHTPAGREGRIYQIDGSLIHWPGTRLGRALAELPALLSE